MKSKEFEDMWAKMGDSVHRENAMSLENIRETTMQFSSQQISESKRGIVFDSIYKGSVLTIYGLLLFWGDPVTGRIIFSAAIIVILAFLIYRNALLNRRFTSIDNTEPVFKVLQNRYEVYQQYFREFIFSNSITHTLFVFAGYQLYLMFKYGEDRFYQLIGDPVIYAFLVATFLMSYITQKFLYSGQIKEMEALLSPENEETDKELAIIEYKAKRRTRILIFSVAAFIGAIVLLTILAGVI